MRIKCTLQSVSAIIAHCQAHVQTGKIVLKKHMTASAACPKQEKTWAMPQDDCPNVLHKVTWQPSVSAWAVHMKTDSGTRVTEKLRIPAVKCGLSQLGVDQKENFKRLRRDKYIEALQFWNEKDSSTRERLVIPPLNSSAA